MWLPSQSPLPPPSSASADSLSSCDVANNPFSAPHTFPSSDPLDGIFCACLQASLTYLLKSPRARHLTPPTLAAISLSERLS
ncbi:hypothetical protein [Rubritalea tangerina]|uniref:hypothetical protein n=1 Tax=Rubritalea tangerina TaxID=430798 RepID=UPI003618A9EE